MEKVDLSFSTILNRIQEMAFPPVDLVVGIATGGVITANLIAIHLGKPLEIIQINYRDESNTPQYDMPRVLYEMNQKISDKRILLVDDVSVSGKTLDVAKSLLADNQVFTFVLKGTADYCAFPELGTCVNWPWKVAEKN